MSQARAPCPNCDLPFYAERNTACPYCGSAAADTPEEAAGEAGTEEERRARVTCPECGLPHYEDTEGDCPYCAAAGSDDHVHEADTAAGTDAGATDTGAGTAEPTDPHEEEAAGAADPQASAGSASTGEKEQVSASQSGGRSSSGGVLGFIKGLFGR